ncbi:MAG TPA: transglycosylase domain-containing protein [Acidimicrobiia bacterium]|nr:transglycosylase domain-containing protein [Acidimicrobiia bacterium]
MDISIHEAQQIERQGRRFVAFAVLAAIVVLAATWVGLFAFLGVNTATGTVEDFREAWIPDVEGMTLDLPNLSRLSTVYTADGVQLGELTERNSRPVTLEEIPNLVIGAVLSAEDDSFMTHGGVDYKSVARAFLADLSGGNTQGGSTISQQVVKQNFIGAEPTLKRKVAEAAIAIELERRYTKEQILEFYLNSVYFGSNAYGVKAAAQEYFGKDLADLTIAEAAALPVPIRNPSLYNLRDAESKIPIRARDAVIDNMVDNGYITAAEGAAAKEEPIDVVAHQEFQDPAPQVLIAARDTVLNDAEYGLGATFLQRKRALFGCPADDTECQGGGGLKIYTTVDFALQERAREILQDWFPPESGLPTGAIAMVDNRTGATVVMASGLDFGTDIASGQRQYDLATKGRRNPGSAFKPFGLIAALEQGIPLNSYWDYSTPQTLDYGGIEPWSCRNAGDNAPGVRSLEEGLYRSTNTVFCQVAIAVGAQSIVDVAHTMGIKSPLAVVPAVVLGASAVSPLEMASAYSTIANQGAKVDNYLIERIEDSDGNVIYQHQVSQAQVLEPALAAAVINTMEKVVSQGTGGNAYIGRPQIGKTGTHENYLDAWFVGAVPQFTTAVWVGFPDAQIPMVNLTIQGTFIPRMFGSSAPAPIWKEFMDVVLTGMPVEDFPEDPPGTAVYYATPRVRVPDVAGMDYKKAEREMRKAGLDVDIKLVNSEVAKNTVSGSDPVAGARVEQGTVVEIEVSNGLSPIGRVPNLIGLKRNQANTTLSNLSASSQIPFTWVFDGEVATSGQGQNNTVASTVPAAGSSLTENTVIHVTLYVYSP